MLKKVCFSPDNCNLEMRKHEDVCANPEVLQRFTKLAKSIKNIAPKSDDFLYFSIIFLKAAESALIDDHGHIKKVGKEDAWGFFDESWKWHGNVPCHKNNNNDIFPESELKKATAEWIGKPLCRDHESSSVDGIRGIILDTHYDEKYKQVIGLCALDKVNYPDLARKVETGMVRFGSMGTAVETSICSECQNKATNQNEYCKCITAHAAHGEINVGLKPIEYSLVVQPAEPGAVLLKCIASLREYRRDFTNYGVDNVSDMLGKLSLQQAEHLNGIMKTACGGDSCSVEDRSNIVKGFLKNNGLLKNSFLGESENIRNIGETLGPVNEAAVLLGDPNISEDAKRVITMLLGELEERFRPDLSSEKTKRVTTYDNDQGDVREPSSVSSRMSLDGGGDTGDNPNFQNNEDDILSFPSDGEITAVSTATDSRQDQNVKIANSGDTSGDFVNDFSINSIMEDIMNESRLRKRAALRRRIAYMQGGSEGAEPNTYKSEPSTYAEDKHMKQDANLGGTTGMVPGDAEIKGKLSRAQLKERKLKRMAYMQGGSEGVEPNTYKHEPFGFDKDKHMHQTGNMGGDSGVFPGDAEIKGKLSRAAYKGPGLSTRFTVKRALDGSVDKANSVLEVFAGKKRVIAARGSEIFGPELEANWEWLKSQDYGKEVCREIRASGLPHVSKLLKIAQEMPEMEAMPEMPAMPEMEAEMPAMEELPPMEDMPELDEEAEPEEAEPEEPGVGIDNRLSEMEQLIDEIRDLVGELEDGSSADVDVNVFTGKEDGAGESEMTALSSKILKNLKVAFNRLDSSADELSMVAETYDNIEKLSSAQKTDFVKLAQAAIRDADMATGESRAIVRLATGIAPWDEMAGEAADEMADEAADEMVDEAADGTAGLVSDAMLLRKNRREALLKQARKDRREAILKQAESRVKADKKANKLKEDTATDEMASDVLEAEEALEEAPGEFELQAALSNKMQEKKADDVREAFRVKLRRAYDVGLDMQNKGLLPTSKASLDRQVDEIMSFDDNAFEAFKRSIANARPVGTMKIASDLGGVNIGIERGDNSAPNGKLMSANALSSLWE